MKRAFRSVLVTVGVLGLGVPAVVAAAPPASAVPSPCTGNVKVTNTDTHTDIGFVSKTWNSFGEFVVTMTPSDYLSVSLTPGSRQNIMALNGQNPSFPLVGGIVGFANTSDNLGPGSFNYAYLGGTTATAPGATPQTGANAFTSATGIAERIESAIWTLDDRNNLSPQWINTDASAPVTHLVDITGILVMTGDVTTFTNTFGPSSNVALTFVATAPCTDNDLGLTGVPGNISVAATGPSGAVVTYTPPTATDEGGGTPSATVMCSPASGSTFPIGTTTVTCTATDGDDTNSPVTASFTVTVLDNDLALSGVPANITTTVNTNGGAIVTYTPPTAVDEESGATVMCSPASGSFFPIGTTTVTCTATDADDSNSPVTATFTVTVTKSPTKTTITANPISPALGSPVTFTATVAPVPAIALTPTGTVSFYIDGSATPAATVALSGGSASFTTSGLGAGTHTVKASYSGDSNFLASSSTTQAVVTVTCTTTMTGHSGTLVLGAGSTCVIGGTISGAVVVPRGALLDLEGVTVVGSISSSGAAFIRVCATTVNSVAVNGSTGFVLIGDAGDDGCGINTLHGSLTLQNNTGGVEAIGNHVAGAITVSGNSGTGPFPEDTAPDITGNGP